MEGIIPFVYKAVVQYKNGGLPPTESPPASYMRLPGDSGRFQILQSDLGFLSCSSPSSAAKRTLSTGVQSPGVHSTSHRAIKRSPMKD